MGGLIQAKRQGILRGRVRKRLVLKQGQRGTKQLSKKYGEDLPYVRFRYDAESRQRLKTVELIVERTE